MTWETVTLAAVGGFAVYVITLEIRDTRRARRHRRDLDQLVRAKRILGVEAALERMGDNALHEARLQRAMPGDEAAP